MEAAELEGSTLYVVATPIGNLRDVTLRALDVLRSAQHIAAEDTRHSRRLLDHYGIGTPLMAAHEHNEARAAEQIVSLLAAGASVALISDAGTPAISDPGAMIVQRVRAAGYRVVPIPGASAVIAAMSAAGLPQGEFVFHGFLPAKAEARKNALAHYCDQAAAIVFYEAPHRIIDTLDALLETFGPERRVLIAREITKTFENLHECALGESLAWIHADENREKGEFVLIVHGRRAPQSEQQAAEAERVLLLLLEDLPASQAARLAAKITGARKNALYERALQLTEEKTKQ